MRAPSLAMSGLIAAVISALISLLAGLWWQSVRVDLRARVDQIAGQAYLAGVMTVHATSAPASGGCPAHSCLDAAKPPRALVKEGP